MHLAITPQSIQTLVTEFYRQVRADELLGPVFNKAIGVTDEEWAPHLEKIGLFWAGVMLGSKGYEGNPLQVHRALPPFDAKLFSRWLALFANTAIETHAIAPATAFIRKAVSIASMMARDLYGGGFDMPPMPNLPDGFAHYRTSPVFRADSIPDALRRAHRTAPATYGRIAVNEGRLLYTIGREQCHVLTSDEAGIIEPEKLHFVTPLDDDTAFAVEFYR